MFFIVKVELGIKIVFKARVRVSCQGVCCKQDLGIKFEVLMIGLVFEICVLCFKAESGFQRRISSKGMGFTSGLGFQNCLGLSTTIL